MWPYIWCYPVLLTAVSALRVSSNSSENVADVIKNISRVNEVLQQLIQNYEHLQKIYKSQENVEAPHHGTARKGNHSVTKKDNAHNRDNFTPTKMILSESEEVSEDTSKESTETTSKDTSESKNKHKTTLTTATPVKISFSLQNARPKLIFIDTPKEGIDEDIPKKTRFSIQANGIKKKRKKTGKRSSYFTSTSQTRSLTPLRTGKNNQNNTETDNKLVPNNEVSPTTIVNLKGHKEVKQTPSITYSFGGKQKRKSNQSNPKFYNNFKHQVRNKSAIGLNKETKKAAAEAETIKSSMDLSDNVEDLAKYVAETNILRKKYGDACLKLVVQKCYKACKEVLKNVCLGCKETFRDTYDGFSRNGCIKSFVPISAVKVISNNCTDTGNCLRVDASSSTQNSKENKKKMKRKVKRKRALREHGIEININDNTHGYLTAVCHPPARSLAIPAGNEPVTNTTAYERSLQLLRTNYEKACIKTSREKCQDACTFSYTKACEKFKCRSRRVKDFNKECTRQCKLAYKYESIRKDSSSIGTSSSDTDSSLLSDSSTSDSMSIE